MVQLLLFNFSDATEHVIIPRMVLGGDEGGSRIQSIKHYDIVTAKLTVEGGMKRMRYCYISDDIIDAAKVMQSLEGLKGVRNGI